MKGTPYNTNNAWGFGGSVGVELKTQDGWLLRKGTACYRHGLSVKVCYAIGPSGQKFFDLHTRSGQIAAERAGMPRRLILAAKGLK